MSEKQYTYADIGRLSNWLVGLLVLNMTSIVVFLVLLFAQYRFLDEVGAGKFTSQADLQASAKVVDAGVALSGGIVSTVGLVTLFLFFVWCYRASANVHAMGALNLDATPGFFVGSFFIPIVNLFFPPRLMREVWKASTNAANWNEVSGTWLIPLWWVFYLFVGISSGVLLFVKPVPGWALSEIVRFSIFAIAVYTIDLGLQVLRILLVYRLSKAQRAQYAARESQEAVFA